jgi:neutral ceramidase
MPRRIKCGRSSGWNEKAYTLVPRTLTAASVDGVKASWAKRSPVRSIPARAWFVRCMVAAAREALADLQPAEFGHGQFEEPRFVRNRLVKELGTVDSTFAFLVIRQTEGDTAILGSYAAHATVLGGTVMEFSGDYPGYWQRAIEQRLKGSALFLAGSVGSHGPVAGASGFQGAERMGMHLAERVLETLPAIALTNIVTLGITAVDVALPELHVRLTSQIRLRPWLSRRLVRLPRSESFLQAFRLNEALWIATPCDFSGELALGVKDFFARQGFRANLTSFNGDYIGYVIPSRYYHLPGYEPRVMSFYGPHLPDYLTELIRGVGLAAAAGVF